MPLDNNALATPSGNRVRSYGKALATNYALTVVNTVTYIVVVPWYVRWLGTERFGVWLILLQLIYTASLVTMWIAAPLTREAADCYVRRDPGGLARVSQTASMYYAAWGALLLVIVAGASRPVLGLLHLQGGVAGEATSALVVVALSFVASMQLNVLLSLLVGYQRMHVSNLLQACSTVTGAAVALVLVHGGGGIVGVASGQLIGNMVAYALAYVSLRRTSGARLVGMDFDRAILRRVLVSGSNYLWYCLSYLLLQSDTLLVGFMLGAKAAAAYGIAFRITDQAVQMVWRIPDALFPVTSELSVRSEMSRFRPAHRIASKLSLAVAIFGAGMLAFLGRWLIRVWVGSSVTVSEPVLIALAAALVMQVFVHSNVIVPYGASRMKGIAIAAVVEALLKVGLAVALIPRLGMAGAAVATVIAQLLCTGWYAALEACRITEDTVSSYVRGVIVPAVVAGAALAGCLWIVSRQLPSGPLQLAVGVVAGATTSALLLLMLGLRADERRWVAATLMRLVRAERPPQPVTFGSMP